MARRMRWPTSWSSWIACDSERSRPICTAILWCSSGARWREAISRAMPTRVRLQPIAGNRLADDAERAGLRARNVAADQRDMGELLHRQAAVQQCRGDQLPEAAAQDFRHAELRILGGVDEIMAVHDAERAAEAIAVHLRDGDARECAQRLGDLDGEARAVPVGRRAVRHLAQEVEVEAGGIDRRRRPC